MRKRRLLVAGAVVGVLVLAAAVGIGVRAARTSGGDGPSPQAVSDTAGVTVGRDSARITIEVYEDPLCAGCATFEQEVGPQLEVWRAAGTAKVQYQVVALLDGQSDTRYSSRAAAALYCAADAGAFPRYHGQLIGRPGERTDDQLIAEGQQAGIEGPALETFRQCVTTAKYGDFVRRISDRASRDGVLSTPTVLVDGRPVQPPTLTAVNAAVADAT